MGPAVRAAAIGLVGTAMVLVLRRNTAELALLLVMAVCVVIIWQVSDALLTIIDYVSVLSSLSSLSEDVLMPVFRSVGIGLTARIAGDVCRDAGESGVASFIDFAGCVCCLYVTLPLVKKTVDMVQELI
ncbi:MAG: hypothetical protein GXX89_02945 [Clostridiales bacterium]|jgi:stage III sporulation protein AD|nr:hypothetical protein [Clostridiales bacterium]